MRLKNLIVIFLLNLPLALSAQQLMSPENNWFATCNCTEITLTSDGGYNVEYVNDTVNSLVVKKLYNPELMSIDTFYYNERGQITEQQGYIIRGSMNYIWIWDIYTYSEKGQLLTAKGKRINYLYEWDEKGRPIKFTETVEGDNHSDVISFKYINDTTALLEYRNKDGVLIATGKRILNKRYQVVSEVLKNPVKGTEAHYVFKYYANGKLRYMQKTKVIKDEVLFFGSTHYKLLYDTTRKLEFTYDSAGRLLTQTKYTGLDLQKASTIQHTYK